MPQIDPSVFKKWHSIYPCYMNSNTSIQDGRRLPRSVCVPNPQVPEISMCLSGLRLRHVVEPVSDISTHSDIDDDDKEKGINDCYVYLI